MQKLLVVVTGVVLVGISYLVAGWGSELLRTLQDIAESLQKIASSL